MPESALQPSSLEAFLAWDSGDDRRYELLEGRVESMAPPSAAHTILASTLARHIGNALEGRSPCTVRSEAGIIVGESTWFQADLAVTCAPHQHGQQAIELPLLIVEVLSPATERRDRMVKRPAYMRLRSVQEILFVDSQRMAAEVYRYEPNGWLRDQFLEPAETVWLNTVHFEVTLARLYDGIDLADRPLDG